MGEYLDTVRRMSITATSPEGAIVVKYGGEQGYRIEVGPNGLSGQTEESLSREFDAAFDRARKGVDKALAMVAERVGSGAAAADRPSRTGQLRTEVRSPLGAATAVISGARQVSMTLKKGALRRLNDEQLTTELNTALRKAGAEHLKAQLSQLRRDRDRRIERNRSE